MPKVSAAARSRFTDFPPLTADDMFLDAVVAPGEMNPLTLAPALIGFNLGIELGQAMIIAVVFPLLLAIRRFQWSGFAQAAVGSGAAAIGLFWLSQRVLGG